MYICFPLPLRICIRKTGQFFRNSCLQLDFSWQQGVNLQRLAAESEALANNLKTGICFVFQHRPRLASFLYCSRVLPWLVFSQQLPYSPPPGLSHELKGKRSHPTLEDPSQAWLGVSRDAQRKGRRMEGGGSGRSDLHDISWWLFQQLHPGASPLNQE